MNDRSGNDAFGCINDFVTVQDPISSPQTQKTDPRFRELLYFGTDPLAHSVCSTWCFSARWTNWLPTAWANTKCISVCITVCFCLFTVSLSFPQYLSDLPVLKFKNVKNFMTKNYVTAVQSSWAKESEKKKKDFYCFYWITYCSKVISINVSANLDSWWH